jgi:signal transduction histidine kinase/CheY-like chemotaxis protein
MWPRTPTSGCPRSGTVYSALAASGECRHPLTRSSAGRGGALCRIRAAFSAYAVLLLSAACDGGGIPSERKLESAGAVWQLSPSDARRGYPVSIHGTVTYLDSRLGILTVQDSTYGIALDTSGVLNSLSPGQQVDVDGFTGYEANAPIIVKPAIRTGAETRPFPPKRVDKQSLWSGRADYQWVEVDAKLVERLSLDSEHSRYRLLLDEREAECTVATTEAPQLTPLVGSNVVIRAVPISARSASGSVVGLHLYVPPGRNIIAVGTRPPAGTAVTTDWRLTQPGPGLPMLDSALQVKTLSHEEALRHYPVRLRAVVTFLNPEWSGPVLQDHSGAIYARIAPEDRQGWRLGDLVEIEGVTSSGGFSPTIWTRAARRLGPGALPAPRPFQGFSLLGRDENAWVRLSGVVRSVGKWEKAGLTVNVGCDWGLIPVRIVEAETLQHPEQLIDAEITVDAVGGPLFDEQRHLYSVQLWAQSAAQLKVTQAPLSLADIPAEPVASVMRFNASNPLNHRIKLIGPVVLRQHKGDIYLASEEGGILVRSARPTDVRVGEQAEAVGFLPPRAPWLVLQDAIVRSSGPGRLPAPKEVTVDEAAHGSYHARLVRLSAFLASHDSVRGDHLLTMNAGRTQFSAVIEHPRYSDFLESLAAGSKLQLTGICHVDFDDSQFPPQPEEFKILIPSVGDIRLLQSAPWWTLSKALIVAGVLAGMALLVLAWVGVLRRRVAAQAAVLLDRMDRERRLQTQLEESQRMESLGRLAGGVAHDFNNLLTIINGYSDLLVRNPHLGAAFKVTIQEIFNAGSRAAGLTRQLLAFSRKQILQPRVLDLNLVVAENESMLRPLIGERIRLEIVLDAKAGMVHADPSQITQVLMNLAVNAKDAMPLGGRLLMRTEDVEVNAPPYGEGMQPAELGEYPVPGPYVCLVVGDTGAGMDEDTLCHIFEPFFTTKAVGEGTGLGLSTVFGIVKQSKGYVTVQSAPGQGTTFHIFLPRAAGTPTPEPDTGPQQLAGEETILVVEDEPEVLALVTSVLRQFGYRVLAAASPQESLSLLRDYRDPIHLVITDIVMPGMTGRQLASEMERIRPGVRILFMSGYTRSELGQEGVLDEGLHFLQKPFTPEALAQRVRAVLSARA